MAIVPFVSRSITDQRAIPLFEQSGDLSSIAGFAPFVSPGGCGRPCGKGFEQIGRSEQYFCPLSLL